MGTDADWELELLEHCHTLMEFGLIDDCTEVLNENALSRLSAFLDGMHAVGLDPNSPWPKDQGTGKCLHPDKIAEVISYVNRRCPPSDVKIENGACQSSNILDDYRIRPRVMFALYCATLCRVCVVIVSIIGVLHHPTLWFKWLTATMVAWWATADVPNAIQYGGFAPPQYQTLPISRELYRESIRDCVAASALYFNLVALDFWHAVRNGLAMLMLIKTGFDLAIPPAPEGFAIAEDVGDKLANKKLHWAYVRTNYVVPITWRLLIVYALFKFIK